MSIVSAIIILSRVPPLSRHLPVKYVFVGAVAQFVEHPSKCSGSVLCNRREFESQAQHKVVGKTLAGPSVEHGNKCAVWEFVGKTSFGRYPSVVI